METATFWDLPAMTPGRNAPREGERSLDQFFTPEWAAERLVETYFPDMGSHHFAVDAGCGRGAFLKAIPSFVPAIGVELDEALAHEARENTRREVVVGDFKSVDLPCPPSVILGNPPFKRAVIDGFIQRASEILPENGRCGFILPTSYVSFASTMSRLAQRFSIHADVLPRDLFPRISVPISFYLFTREHVRRHHGFMLFEEADAVRGLSKPVRLALYRGENRRSAWHTAVASTLMRLGGRATLTDLYRAMQGKQPSRIETWKDTVRRVLQEGGFRNVGRGEWAMPEAAG